MNPIVSVITPTFNRHPFLKNCLSYFLAQDYPHCEWLILDDSPEPSPDFQNTPSHVHYQHLTQRLSIGEKRNVLVDQAKGDIIVHFDDDDYYAPHYITTLLRKMQQLDADLINLRGWYLLDLRSHFFGYWDLTLKEGWHYRCADAVPNMVYFGEAEQQAFHNNHLGYGFGYAYRKAIWQRTPFEPINFNEDGQFVLQAAQQFKVDGFKDATGICLHYLHTQSSSICFPQFHLPSVAFPAIFPPLPFPPPNSISHP